MDQQLGRLGLPRYAIDFAAEAVEHSGYPILVSEQEGMGYDAETRMARPGRPVHEVVYDPSFRDHRLHFLVSGAYKIQRLWDMPPEDRLVPATEPGRRLPGDEHEELGRLIPWFTKAHLEDLSRFLYEGAVRQLTSMPMDLRVERELADRVPEHRPEQQRYLARQVQEMKPHFRLEVRLLSPRHLYAATSAMNIAFAEAISDLAGADFGEPFTSSRFRELGSRLGEIIRSEHLPGYQGDRRVVDAWAAELGLDGWYSWERLPEP